MLTQEVCCQGERGEDKSKATENFNDHHQARQLQTGERVFIDNSSEGTVLEEQSPCSNSSGNLQTKLQTPATFTIRQ